MFSSNQKFSVSCREDQLSAVVELALSMHDGRREKRTLAYQTTDDGRFVIGWYHEKPEKGWEKLMFERPSIGLIVEAVKQYAKEHPAKGKQLWDGGYEQGYLVEAVPEMMSDEYDGIKNPFYGIIAVRSYECFYSK